MLSYVIEADSALVKHLNSPLFQKRYLRRENEDIQTAKSVNPVSTQTNGTVNEDSKAREQATKAAETGGSKDEADDANLKDQNRPGEDAKDLIANGTSLEEKSAFSVEKVSPDAVDGDRAIDTQNVLLNRDESQLLDEDPTQLNTEVRIKQDGEMTVPETSKKPEEDQLPGEEDDDDEEGGRRDSDIFGEPVTDDVQEPVRPSRYELSYWPYHLTSAEKLWTAEEREQSDLWKELWKLVIQFLCESPDAFKVWQQHYMELSYEYNVYDTLLSPLQLAAAYGIPGLVKILLDRGELAAAETEDGRSALWFGAISPDIEILGLLLGKGASPNTHKAFLTPFNNLLRWNPKIEFVNLMLEHGAECNIIDSWGSNAMHWFALAGSDVEVLKALINAHGDINVVDASGETPLHVAMYNSQGLSLEMLRAFLENGADVNKDDNDSQSKFPQHYSCNALTTSRAIVRGLRCWKYRGSQDIT